MRNAIISEIEASQIKQNVPDFQVGDTVDVTTRMKEGEKERMQVFSGTVIMRKGNGMNAMFTVRRIVNNEGVERIFPINSPFVSKIEVLRSSITRRAKLYFLRDRVGKAVRLAEKRRVKPKAGEVAQADAQK